MIPVKVVGRGDVKRPKARGSLRVYLEMSAFDTPVVPCSTEGILCQNRSWREWNAAI